MIVDRRKAEINDIPKGENFCYRPLRSVIFI